MLRITPSALALALLLTLLGRYGVAAGHHALPAHRSSESRALQLTPRSSRGSRAVGASRHRHLAPEPAHGRLRTVRAGVRAPLPTRRHGQRSTVAPRHSSRRHQTRNALNVADNPGPRGAAPEDFMEAAASTRRSTRASLLDSREQPHALHAENAASLAEVVSVIRPTAQRPQLPPVSAAVRQPLVLPELLDERGRLVVPAPLRGSHAILVHQNQVADDDGLGRIQDDADLDAMHQRGLLVALPGSVALHVDERLPPNRRLCRPWTAQFLDTLARAHYTRFHTPLQLTSAVRTVAFQQHLLHTNGNAAPADGDTASPHLTGQAIDLGKRGLSLVEIAWLRGYLLPLIEAGQVDVEEEFRQSCFHISVYKRYLPSTPASEHYVVASRAITPALATSLQ